MRLLWIIWFLKPTAASSTSLCLPAAAVHVNPQIVWRSVYQKLSVCDYANLLFVPVSDMICPWSTLCAPQSLQGAIERVRVSIRSLILPFVAKYSAARERLWGRYRVSQSWTDYLPGRDFHCLPPPRNNWDNLTLCCSSSSAAILLLITIIIITGRTCKVVLLWKLSKES